MCVYFCKCKQDYQLISVHKAYDSGTTRRKCGQTVAAWGL